MLTEPILYRVDEAARMLSISRSEAYALVAKGLLPHVRIGSMIRIPVAALKAMAEHSQNGKGNSTVEVDLAQ
jgi:excisionase family DNA binding protein